LKYDKSRPIDNRLVEAKALCQKCRVPEYRLIEDEAIYKVSGKVVYLKGIS